MKEDSGLPLPTARCLSKAQAAKYLGIGVTLFDKIGPKPIQMGRRCVYDRLDLDTWLEEYKQRGRAREEVLWPEKKEDSTVGKTRRTGGSISSCQTDAEYAKVLGL